MEKNTPEKTLIVNYPGLQVGGIEKSLQAIMHASMEAGYRVIWVTTPAAFAKADFREVADDPRLEKAFYKNGAFGKIFPFPRISLSRDEDITMISLTPVYYAWADRIRGKKKYPHFHHFLLLTNFFGGSVYPEDRLRSGMLHTFFAKTYQRIAQKLTENECVRAFNVRQLSAYSERYGVRITDIPKKKLGSSIVYPPLTEEELWAKARERKDCFRIVTCTRFEFPHKGYLLGLVRDFAELLKTHPQSELVIVGYGPMEGQLVQALAALPDAVNARITCVGKVLPDELVRIYKTGHLTVGLAGSASLSAAVFLPTLITRHNCLHCETYGFYGELGGMTLRSDPGEPALPRIRALADCSDAEYVAIAKRDGEDVESRRVYDPLYILKETEKSNCAVLSRRDAFENRLFQLVLSAYHFLLKRGILRGRKKH